DPRAAGDLADPLVAGAERHAEDGPSGRRSGHRHGAVIESNRDPAEAKSLPDGLDEPIEQLAGLGDVLDRLSEVGDRLVARWARTEHPPIGNSLKAASGWLEEDRDDDGEHDRNLVT